MKSPYTDSLAHTTWECKYHIVFASKFRRKDIWKIKAGNRINFERIVQKERSRNNKSRSMSRPYTYVCKHTTEIEHIIIYGIFEREKHINNI